jgi:hypothetical protein
MGLPTASQFHRILTATGKPSRQASSYINSLLAELMMGRPLEGVTMPWMERGKNLEAEARAFYALQTDREPVPVGFIVADDGMCGCSPDSLVGDDGMLEIKCPAPWTHVDYLMAASEMDCDALARADEDYRQQVQGQLLVTGRAWLDMVSYHPEMPNAIVRVFRDHEYIAKVRAAIIDFNEVLALRKRKLEMRGWIKPLDKTESVNPDKGPELDWLGITDEDIAALADRGTE